MGYLWRSVGDLTVWFARSLYRFGVSIPSFKANAENTEPDLEKSSGIRSDISKEKTLARTCTYHKVRLRITRRFGC